MLPTKTFSVTNSVSFYVLLKHVPLKYFKPFLIAKDKLKRFSVDFQNKIMHCIQVGFYILWLKTLGHYYH